MSPFLLAHRALRRKRADGSNVVPGFPPQGIGAYTEARGRGETVTRALQLAHDES